MFTENQVRQFYVANGAIEASAEALDQTAIETLTATVGNAQFVLGNTEGYLMYSGSLNGDLQRSDLIKKCNVMDVRLTDAADLAHKKKLQEIAIASTLLSSSNLTVTGDYVLNIDIHGYLSPDYNSTKVKFAVAHGTAGDSASDLYKKLAISLAKNFAREAAPLVKVMVKISSSYTEVLPNNAITDISGTASCIAIEEVEQPWRRGAAPVEYVNFEARPSTIYNGSDDVIWGEVTDKTATNTNVIVNSKKTADMEWFFHKERGDRYAEAGFPYNIDTTYMVDPAEEDGYSFIDIHYYFEGNCHNVGKSEKTLTIVGAKEDLQTLVGAAESSSGGSTTPASGLYAWLEGTGVEIKESASWSE